jgi:hypothetical protein
VLVVNSQGLNKINFFLISYLFLVSGLGELVHRVFRIRLELGDELIEEGLGRVRLVAIVVLITLDLSE